MNKRSQAHLALFSTSIIYAATFTIAKSIMPSLIAPYGFIFVRVVIAGLLFWLLACLPAYRQPIAKKDWPRFLLCGVFGVAINQLSFFKGLSYTTPIHASLMMLTTPICVTIIAAFLIREKITQLKVIGLLCGVSGALLLIMMAEQKGGIATNIMLGDALVFLNAVSYAYYLVIVKPLMVTYKPAVVNRYVFTIGFFLILPFGFNEFTQIPWETFQTSDWLAVGYVVLIATFLTYQLSVFALNILSASTVGAYIYLQPIFAALIAIVFFGETLTVTKVVSAILIFSGVYMVSYKPKAKLKHS